MLSDMLMHIDATSQKEEIVVGWENICVQEACYPTHPVAALRDRKRTTVFVRESTASCWARRRRTGL